jgi:hypothetical protein
MHLKVFLKLKKPLTLSSGQKNPKKKQKNPLGWFKKKGFFQPCPHNTKTYYKSTENCA